MGNVQLLTHVHATVVTLKIQRTTRIASQFAVPPVIMGNVQDLTYVHATVDTPKIQRIVQIVYQFAVHLAPMEYV
jgi:multidrug efflux pump subunit AcrA (membrane-fusion protein)